MRFSVGRRHQPHVDAPGARAAQALNLLLLQDPQQLGLQVERHVPDLIEEQRALVRQFKAAELLDEGTGEGPPLMAEQLALQQPRRHGSTIHRDEGVVLAYAELMDGACEAFFARAGFALEKDGGVRRCHNLHLPQHFFEGRACADDLFTMVRSLEPIFDQACCLG